MNKFNNEKRKLIEENDLSIMNKKSKKTLIEDENWNLFFTNKSYSGIINIISNYIELPSKYDEKIPKTVEHRFRCKEEYKVTVTVCSNCTDFVKYFDLISSIGPSCFRSNIEHLIKLMNCNHMNFWIYRFLRNPNYKYEKNLYFKYFMKETTSIKSGCFIFYDIMKFSIKKLCSSLIERLDYNCLFMVLYRIGRHYQTNTDFLLFLKQKFSLVSYKCNADELCKFKHLLKL